MAQIIKNRRGSLDRLSSATGSLQKGEILIATGSSKLTGVTNGQGLVFAAVESGSVVAANRVLQGATAPIFSASSYGNLMDGIPFYASSSNTLFLLGADGNTTPDLTGNISTFSASVATSFSASNASIASVTGDFSASVATSFSASNASVTALSASTYNAVFGFAGFSASVATSLSQSAHNVGDLSGSIATTITNLSSSLATTDSASAAQISALSASVASVTGDFSSSVATSFSASAASQNALSGAIATTDSASAAYAASQLSSVSGAFATSTSASNYQITELSASVASVGGTFSSSVATDFSASTAARVALSASIAVTDNAQSDRLGVIESTYATTGSNTFKANQIISGSLSVTGDVIIYGSSSLVNVSASALNIGDNTIILSTASPAVRFGGISVQDSGSANGVSGSLFWDSLNNNWIYQHPLGGGESAMSAILISGPKNSGSLGDEAHITPGRIMVAVGDDHIGDSIISASATKVTVEGELDVTGNISSSTISGIGNVTEFSSSIATSFSSSAYNVSSLSASVASVGGTFSSSVATTITNLSSSVATSISASNFEITVLSASVASVGGTFSSSVATDFSASTAARVALSASIATLNNTQTDNIATLTSKTGSYATTGSNVFNGDQVLTGSFDMTGTLNVNNAVAVNDSNMNLGNSSSLNLTGGSSIYVAGAGTISGSIVGIGNVTLYSASVESKISASAHAISTLNQSSAQNLSTLSTSVDARLDVIETTYATTGSNTFKGEQIISSSLLVTNEIKGTGSIFLQPDSTDSRKLEIYNTAATDVHIKSTGGLTFLGDDTNYVKIDDSAATITIESTNGVTIDTSVSISAELSASTIRGIGNVSLFSSSVDSRFSASVYDISILSASVASVGGTFSSSVATDFSASNAARVALSQSVYDTLYWPTTGLSASLSSGSQYQVNVLSASVYDSVFGMTGLSASVSSSLATLSGSVSSSISTLSSSVSQSIYETIFSGTNPFSLSSSFASASAAYSSSAATFVSESIYQKIYFPSTGLSASFDTRFSASAYNVAELSASVASVGGTFSSSVATDFSASTAARVALSSSVANDFSASTAYTATTINNLSASIATTDNTQTGRIDALESYSSSLKTAIELTGSSVTIQGDLLVRGTTTSVNSTTIDLGDNIINLNGSGATNGGLYVKDVTNPNTATGSLLWDSTNDYWKAGVKDSEYKVLLAVGDSVFSSSIQTALSGTFGYSDFSSSIATSFSASAASIASVTGDFSSSVATSFSQSTFTISQLSASVASVTGDFSSSVATSFSSSAAYAASQLSNVSGAFATSTSASNYQITELSASVASVGGTFSSSVATSFSASYANITNLSGSIYLTDSTQSDAITNNSSSFATAVSASNYRITTLETTIDGGSF